MACLRRRYVCERSGKELLEQKGVRNILWLFYLLDKIDEQIEIVLLMEEEERKRLKKLEEEKREKYKNGVKKKTKKKTKKPSKEEDRPNGKANKKTKKKSKNDETDSSDSSDTDSGSCSDGGLTKKAKKRPKKSKKSKKTKKDKKSAIEFDMFLRSGTRIEFLKVRHLGSVLPSQRFVSAPPAHWACAPICCRPRSCCCGPTSSKTDFFRSANSCPWRSTPGCSVRASIVTLSLYVLELMAAFFACGRYPRTLVLAQVISGELRHHRAQLAKVVHPDSAVGSLWIAHLIARWCACAATDTTPTSRSCFRLMEGRTPRTPIPRE